MENMQGEIEKKDRDKDFEMGHKVEKASPENFLSFLTFISPPLSEKLGLIDETCF